MSSAMRRARNSAIRPRPVAPDDLARVDTTGFADRVMSAVRYEPAPTPTRSFMAALRARSAREAVSALWVAWHLGTVRRWSIDPRVRARSLALVLAVSGVLMTGSLAAAGVVRVAAEPIAQLLHVGLDEHSPAKNDGSGQGRQGPASNGGSGTDHESPVPSDPDGALDGGHSGGDVEVDEGGDADSDTDGDAGKDDHADDGSHASDGSDSDGAEGAEKNDEPDQASPTADPDDHDSGGEGSSGSSGGGEED